MRRVLRGHRGAVLALFAVDNLLLSGGRDNVVRVWDMEALVCRRVLAGHKDDVVHISGARLAAPDAEAPAIGDRDPSPAPDPSLGTLFATARRPPPPPSALPALPSVHSPARRLGFRSLRPFVRVHRECQSDCRRKPCFWHTMPLGREESLSRVRPAAALVSMRPAQWLMGGRCGMQRGRHGAAVAVEVLELRAYLRLRRLRGCARRAPVPGHHCHRQARRPAARSTLAGAARPRHAAAPSAPADHAPATPVPATGGSAGHLADRLPGWR